MTGRFMGYSSASMNLLIKSDFIFSTTGSIAELQKGLNQQRHLSGLLEPTALSAASTSIGHLEKQSALFSGTLKSSSCWSNTIHKN